MGRRKQSRPHRSGGLIIENNDASEAELERLRATVSEPVKEELLPYFVEADRESWSLDEHLDLSEIILSDLHLREGYHGLRINEDFYKETKYSLRFCVRNVDDSIRDRIKLGHWPVLSSGNMSLEIIEKCLVEDGEIQSVILSGSFDGPDEGFTGLIHLTSIRFLTLRPILGVELSDQMASIRVRVEILKSAFDACESLQENTRQIWKKSMMSVMSWLRPEVMTSEVRYGLTKSRALFTELIEEMVDDESKTGKQPSFDVTGFYEAIKPSKSNPMLEDALPDLLPVLRPYQRRAAYWMVQQEKGISETSGGKDRNCILSPLSVPVEFLDTCLKMFYNPFSGSVSLHSEFSSPHLFGGILADEMGLGKTLELLACIFAHQKSPSESNALLHTEHQQVNLKRVKKERVECVCGAVTESYKYGGLWVQCDICNAWQHADCVGYSPTGKKKKVPTATLR